MYNSKYRSSWHKKLIRIRNRFIIRFTLFFTSQSMFKDVKTYCMFIGYGRSGHSIIGAMLDAHPNIIIGHEQDVLRDVRKGCANRTELFLSLLHKSKIFHKERINNPRGHYNYNLPNLWQGKYSNLVVIGDKKGESSVHHFRKSPELFEQLQGIVQLPIQLIHIVRNPYDCIATAYIRRNENKYVKKKDTLQYRIDSFFSGCPTIARFRKNMRENIFEMRSESFIENPEKYLKELCTFFNVLCPDIWLHDCAAMVFKKPNYTRHNIEWTNEDKEMVDRKMKEFEWFQGYSF